jgi:hypothetical protein
VVRLVAWMNARVRIEAIGELTSARFGWDRGGGDGVVVNDRGTEGGEILGRGGGLTGHRWIYMSNWYVRLLRERI